jgi:hypothetical protein
MQVVPRTSAAAAAAAVPGDRTLEQQQLTELFRNFLPQVVASCELHSEAGQTAALELLLCPAALPLLPSEQRVLPLCMALRLGLRHPEAAAVAVSALEALEQQQQLQALLPVLVPLLNPYLQDLSAVPPAEDAADWVGFEQATSAADNENEDSSTDRLAGGAAAGGGASGGVGSSAGGSAAADQARLYRYERRQAMAERKSKGAARKVCVRYAELD